jgi:hypothetical protein
MWVRFRQMFPLAAFVSAAFRVHAANDALFAEGQYPPGPLYKTEDLPGLIGRPLKKPAYLIGDFLYVGKVNGRDSFATYTSPPLRLGNTAVLIGFHHNFPPTLVAGRAVQANRSHPIALLGVTRSTDGKVIAVGEDIIRSK